MNKYGAYLLTSGMIELLKNNGNGQLAALKKHILKDTTVVGEKAPHSLPVVPSQSTIMQKIERGL